MDYKNHNEYMINNVFLPNTHQDLFSPGEFISSNGVKCVSVSWSAPSVKAEPQDYMQQPTDVLIPEEKIKTEVKLECSESTDKASPAARVLSEMKKEGEYENSKQSDEAETSALQSPVRISVLKELLEKQLWRPPVLETRSGETVHLPIHFQDHSYTRRHFSCAACNVLFSDQHSYIQHINKHSPCIAPGKIMPCPVCRKTCTEATLEAHKASHIKCPLCNTFFLKNAALEVHKKSHFKCHLCNALFLDKHSCMQHRQKHLQPKSQPEGGKFHFQFVRKYEPVPDILQRCMKETKCNPEMHMFRCPLCKAPFGSPAYLHAHLRLCHNEACD